MTAKKKPGRWGLVFLFLLLAGAAATLYAGVERYSSEDGEAVIVSRKSRGWQPELLEAGRTYWFWERLIPGFFSRQRFPLEVQQLRLELDFQLPQAQLYRDFAVGRPDFSYLLALTVRYRLPTDRLLALVQQQDLLSPADIASFYASQEGEIRQALLPVLQGQLAAEPAQAEAQLLSRAQQQGQVEVLAVALQRWQAPDLALYQRAKENYRAFNREQGGQLLRNNVLRALLQDDTDAQLANLRKLGETLEQYPNVLDYLKLFEGQEGRWQLPAATLPSVGSTPGSGPESTPESTPLSPNR